VTTRGARIALERKRAEAARKRYLRSQAAKRGYYNEEKLAHKMLTLIDQYQDTTSKKTYNKFRATKRSFYKLMGTKQAIYYLTQLLSDLGIESKLVTRWAKLS
jgi:hypothetical protein